MTKAILCENSEGGVAITVVEERTVKTPAGLLRVTLASELARMKEANPDKTFTIVDAEKVAKKYAESPFRSAWKTDLTTDISKAKEMVHKQRKAKRAEQFAPLDVEATIPALAEVAESKRQAIREANATIQNSIKSASTEAELVVELGKVT